jgi:hypothetical protein
VYQDWQSHAFFYHAHKVGQPGNVTRIVSGCTPDEQHQLLKSHDIQWTLSPDFHIHFTPDYSNRSIKPNKPYRYFNKPFGMKHWMEHALGYNESTNNQHNKKQAQTNVNDDTVIILLDPDQILLRPLTHDYNDVNMKWMPRRNANLSKVVQRKSTMAQAYGYGNQWLTKVNLTQLLPDNDKTSPLWKLSRDTAARFAAGPPYLAAARDMHSIVQAWADFVPKVFDQFPALLAEMFAYNLASHHVHRRPMTSPGFMVSDVTLTSSEGWYWMEDSLPPSPSTFGANVCRQRYPPSESPFILHYCNVYEHANFSFTKRTSMHNILSCASDLFVEPDTLISVDQPSFRASYMLCRLIPALNEAFEHFKRHNCQDNSTNYVKRKRQDLTKPNPANK